MAVMGPLIDATTLREELDGVFIVDCRFALGASEAGHQDYLAGHIAGAAYANLDTDLSDLSRTGLGRHPLPAVADVSAMLVSKGWQPGQPLVAYDTAGGALAAARLWWMARQLGIDARVLDGGFQTWQQAGGVIEQGEVAAEATAEPPALRFDPHGQVDYTRLEQLRGRAETLVIDARAGARFRGEVEPIDPVAGHLPGAVNRPFADNLDANGCFKSVGLLRQEFAALLGEHAATEVIHMCGSGVTACHNALAMEVAGLSGARLFAPSWSGWVTDTTRAVARGH